MNKGCRRVSTTPLSAFALATLLFGPAIPSQAQVLDVIPYSSGDYRYQTYVNLAAVPPAWASPSFDDSAFSVGATPFGSGGGCAVQAGVSTNWPSPSVVLLRRTFFLPFDAANVKVYAGIDNNVRIAVNGNLLGLDFTRHSGCPERGDYFWDVPQGFLNIGGSNVLAVLAEDHSAESWIDLRMTVFDPPATCGNATVSPGNVWSPNHKLFVPLAISVPNLGDGTEPLLIVRGVTQDEPVSGEGAGNASPDAVIENGVLKIRVERSGSGNGRVYRVRLSARFDPGGSCGAVVHVCVPHSNGGTCVDDGQFFNSLLP